MPYAALIEPLTVAWHAVKVPQNPTYKGATILILGGGPIGVALTFVLRRFGAGRIFISEPTKRRREQNVEIADEVFDPTSQDVASLCMERTGGVGVDFVFDAAGNLKGLADGVDAVKSRGTIVVVAVYGLKPVSFNLLLVGMVLMRDSSLCHSCPFLLRNAILFARWFIRKEIFEKLWRPL